MTKAAFFDVDETLIQYKSMFAFLDFFLETTGLKLQGDDYAGIMSKIHQKVEQGATRAEINAYYYQWYKDISQKQVQHYAQKFFSQHKATIFKNLVQKCLQNHIENNVKVVFVSGAMPDILLPIANHLHVNQFICSLPKILNGCYTGEMIQQAIGLNKAELIQVYALENKIDLKQSYAYGDHISDQYMLDLVGNPYVIDPDDELLILSKEKGWKLIYTQ